MSAPGNGPGNGEAWLEERLRPSLAQKLRIDKQLYRDKTEHQDLIVFEHQLYGRVMALDGIVQTTEADEFVYHEMMTHVPILAHGAAKRVLIVGGGDGGMAEEALKHPLERLVQVEIDRTVVDIARAHLPSISGGAYDDPRMELLIADGARYVQETDERFDVVIVDSTDPVGPGEILFSQEFYAGCKRCLTPGGLIVTQNGIPFFERYAVENTSRRLGRLFSDVSFFLAPVPAYIGGFMAFGWGTDNTSLRRQPVELIAERFKVLGTKLRYYNPAIHQAAFAHPQFLVDILEALDRDAG